jgi:hypothetical protein
VPRASGAGPIHHHAVAALLNAHPQWDGLAEFDAVIIDMILEGPFAIGQLAQRGAGQPLGVVQQLIHVEAGPGHAVARHQLLEGALGDGAGGELGTQIAEHLDRHPHIAVDHHVQGFVGLAALIEAQWRDAQPFLVNLGTVRGIGARHPPADIRVVADGRGDGDALPIHEDRREQENIGQVHPALEGVVEDEDVALRHRLAVAAHDGGQRFRDAAEVARQGQPLGDQPALGVAEGRGVIHVVLQHRRIGGAMDGQRHVIGDREERVLEQLELDRVVASPLHASPLVAGVVTACHGYDAAPLLPRCAIGHGNTVCLRAGHRRGALDAGKAMSGHFRFQRLC